MANASAFDLHYRLRPVLREIVGVRLGGARAAPRRTAAGGARPGALGARARRREPRRPTGTPRAHPPPTAAPRGRAAGDAVNVEQLAGRANEILDEVERAVVGKREALELVLLGILADGHVLIEDFPGLAKTLIARSFAQVTSIGFARIQFTPDLMPSDVTGSSIYNQREADFEFRPGPIFTNLLLADEINRAPPKTQAALLEAMQERQVTIEGDDAPARAAVPRPRDAEPDRVRGHLPAARGAARPLPAADRRRLPDARARVGDARAPARARGGRGRARAGRRPRRAARDAAGDRAGARRAQRRALHGRPRRGDARAPAASRSARARAARSRCSSSRAAAPRSRAATYVTPDDVKAVAVPALAHRLALRPELWVQRLRAGRHRARAARRGADARGRASPSRAPASDPSGDGEARRVRRARRPRPARRARARAARSSRPSRRRSRCSSSSASRSPSAPRLGALFELERRAPARGRARRRADLELRAERAGPAARAAARPAAWARDRGAEPAVLSGSCQGERRELELRRSAASAGARTSSATSSGARTTAFGLLVFEGRRSSEPHPLKVYPRGEDARAAAAAARDAGVRRQPGRRASAARGSSSPTCGRSRPATACGA